MRGVIEVAAVGVVVLLLAAVLLLDERRRQRRHDELMRRSYRALEQPKAEASRRDPPRPW